MERAIYRKESILIELSNTADADRMAYPSTKPNTHPNTPCHACTMPSQQNKPKPNAAFVGIKSSR
jgi:hypothetical protein